MWTAHAYTCLLYFFKLLTQTYILQVTPIITFSIVLLAFAPCLIKAWRNPQPRMITRWIAYAYTCGFMFGWHVHEKASLHFVIPLAIIALKSVENAKHYFYLSIGNSLFYSLVNGDWPLKVIWKSWICITTWSMW